MPDMPTQAQDYSGVPRRPYIDNLETQCQGHYLTDGLAGCRVVYLFWERPDDADFPSFLTES